jgi:hypothetical protein
MPDQVNKTTTCKRVLHEDSVNLLREKAKEFELKAIRANEKDLNSPFNNGTTSTSNLKLNNNKKEKIDHHFYENQIELSCRKEQTTKRNKTPREKLRSKSTDFDLLDRGYNKNKIERAFFLFKSKLKFYSTRRFFSFLLLFPSYGL